MDGSQTAQSRGNPMRDLETLLTIVLATLIVAPVSASGGERAPLPIWKKRRSALDKRYTVDEFRIYYTLDGDDALPDVVDVNKNSIPDRIENIALQLTTASRLYVETLELRHPLESPRYGDRAEFIDVHVGSLPFEPGGAENKGSAGDGVVNYYRPSDPDGGIEVLTMDVSKGLPTRNVTPAHELFHLFQYGYTMFKVGWFLEGTARWSEFTLREGSGEPKGLPLDEDDLSKLFSMKYEAAGFWITLAHASDSRGQLRIPPDLLRATYIGTYEPIIRDTQFRGAPLLKDLLEALDEADDTVSAALDLEPFAWKESRQRSPDNNPYVWAAVIDVSRKYGRRSKTIRTMVGNLSP